MPTLKVFKAPSLSQRGTDPPTYRALYGVHGMANGVSAGTVLAFARGQGVPHVGETLLWTEGGSTYGDSSVAALDFEVDYQESERDHPDFWGIQVTWRQPETGADERQPGTPPLSRDPEYWIEYHTTQEEVRRAWNIPQIGQGSLLREANKEAPPTTAAGEIVRDIFKDRLRAVLVSQKNVSSPRDALDLNNDFEDTINSGDWSTPFLDVEKHHARFLRAETTGIVQEGTAQFHRMQTRVEIGRVPFYEQIPNRGLRVYSVAKDESVLYRDDDGAVGEVNLTLSGLAAPKAQVPEFIAYRINHETNYNSLPF